MLSLDLQQIEHLRKMRRLRERINSATSEVFFHYLLSLFPWAVCAQVIVNQPIISNLPLVMFYAVKFALMFGVTGIVFWRIYIWKLKRKEQDKIALGKLEKEFQNMRMQLKEGV